MPLKNLDFEQILDDLIFFTFVSKTRIETKFSFFPETE